MTTKRIPKKLAVSTAKIVAIANFLLDEDGVIDWEINEIHLTNKKSESKNSNNNKKVDCRYVKENGRLVLICKKEW